MKCERARELLDAFHDGELPSATSAALEGHLCSCPSCSASVNANNALRRRVRGLGRTPPPARLAATISSSVSEVGRAPSGLLQVRSGRALAASHLLAVVLGGAAVLGLV